jgi:hypothetical protein
LIIDDDPKLVTDAVYPVDIAEKGIAAFEKAQTLRPDLFLLDAILSEPSRLAIDQDQRLPLCWHL